MAKIGIEFEFVCYRNIALVTASSSFEEYKELKLLLDEYISEFKKDYSVKAFEDYDHNCFSSYATSEEWITRPLELKEIPDFLNKLKEITEYVSINEFDKKKKFAIFFNSSTGMHIHYSNKYIVDKTRELYLYADNRILNKIVKEIKTKCKYETIKNSFLRRYTNSRKHFSNTRYKMINISDLRYKGTIEFRLFNLHGIKTVDFIPAMYHIIYDLLLDTINKIDMMLSIKIYNKNIYYNENIYYSNNNPKINEEIDLTNYYTADNEVEFVLN